MIAWRTFPLVFAVACTPRLYTSAGPIDEWVWEAPSNSWPIAEPPTGTVGLGLSVGQTIPELRLIDQLGEEVSTWQFYGRVVVIDISTMWCAPCQELAESTQATQDRFGLDEFIYVTVLQENVESQPPSVENLGEWASFFDLQVPVLADGEKLTASAIQNGNYPAILVIDRELTIRQRVNPVNEANVDAAIEQLLDE